VLHAILCRCCRNPIVLTKPDGAEQTGKQRFNYLFYIDFVGALSDPVCQNALRHLQVRLGAYILLPALQLLLPDASCWAGGCIGPLALAKTSQSV
jgi:hypothetical protein